MVDDYNRSITTDGISICISTRINASNHYWLLTDGNDMEEIYDKSLNQTPKDSRIRIRKLTPKECWRLMAFDDADFEKAEKVNSNSQLYKQAGNSIVVAVLEAIFKEML